MNRYLIILLLGVIMTTSCSQYQEVLKSEELQPKLDMIDTLYAKKKYKKTLSLFEQIIPQVRGTDKAEKWSFKYANVHYALGNFFRSAYQFERFVESHPRSPKREEALFKSAKSNYYLSPKYSLDQEDTFTALRKLQTYIDFYPDGEYADEANKLTAELRDKLDRKDYEIAKGFHHREFYPQAAEAFETYIISHPGSQYLDDAHFYLAHSQYEYAINSVYDKIKERLAEAAETLNLLQNRYPDSEYTDDAEELRRKIEEGMNTDFTTTRI